MYSEQFAQVLEIHKFSCYYSTQHSNRRRQKPHWVYTALLSNFENFVVHTTQLTNHYSFDFSKELFRNYKQRFVNYTEMKSITDNKERCPKLLLNLIEEENLNIVQQD